MNEAIKLAIEKGGYKLEKKVPINDPLFWQALGKALGWENEVYDWVPLEGPDKNMVPPWLIHALHYYRLVLTSGNTELFWKELL